MQWGDFNHMFILCLIMAIMGIIGCIWFPWYEDPAYYVECYGNGSYELIMSVLHWTTIIACAGAIFTKIMDIREKKQRKELS